MLDIYDIFKFGLQLQKSSEIGLDTINFEQSQITELPLIKWFLSFIEHHIILEAFIFATPVVLLIFALFKYKWKNFITIFTAFNKSLQKKREVYILKRIFEENSEKESEEKYVNNYIDELNCKNIQRIVIALSSLQQCQVNEKMIEAILNCLSKNKKNIALRNAIIHTLNSMLNSS